MFAANALHFEALAKVDSAAGAVAVASGIGNTSRRNAGKTQMIIASTEARALITTHLDHVNRQISRVTELLVT